MEFDDLQKVWNAQNNEPIYGINGPALHRRILAKQQQAFRVAHLSEWISIIVYGFTACFIVVVNLRKPQANLFLYPLAAWMLGSALYVLGRRIHRMRSNNQFDRTMQGDLQQAIAIASYQTGLSKLLRWNMLPMGLLVLLSLWKTAQSPWVIPGMLVFFILTWYASGWEHGIYEKKKKMLQNLAKQLSIQQNCQ
jgi:hypothetical protein